MDGDRTHRALLRIDSALARLEAVALEPPEPSAPEPATDADLVARHERLRAAVVETLGRIDTLIASQTE